MTLKKEEIKGYIKKINENSFFTSIAEKLDYERIGLQITKDKEVILELTSFHKEEKLLGWKRGLVILIL